MSASLEILSRLREQGRDYSFAAYRRGVLGNVSDEQIRALAGEGEWRNLWGMLRTRGGFFLRQRISQALGRIEHEELGGVNAPEWTVPHHNVLVEVFAGEVEHFPCPR